MLKQYCSRLCENYKSEGFTSTAELLNKTFVDYLFLELNTIKLRQIERNNDFGIYFRIFSPNFLEQIGKRGIDGLIENLQKSFLVECK